MLTRKQLLSFGTVILCVFCGLVEQVVAGTASPGDLLVTQFSPPHGVRRYHGQTGAFIDIFASNGSSAHYAMTYGPDDHLYAAIEVGFIPRIVRYNGQTGALLGTFIQLPAGNQVSGLHFGPDGHVYIVKEDNEVHRYHGMTGADLGAFVTAGSGGLERAEDFAFGPDGNLYVPDFENKRVLRYSGATGVFIDEFVNDAALGFVSDLLWGADDNLYLLDITNATVRRYNGATGGFLSVFVSPGSGGLTNAFHMAFGPDGNLYIPSGEIFDARVLRYNGQTGALLGVFVTSGSGGLDFPFDLLFVPGCQTAQECNDGNVCNGAESCVTGACASGAPLNCNDSDPCTDDSCVSPTGCVHAFNTAPCDDGNACTGGDVCDGAGQCVGVVVDPPYGDVHPCGGNGAVDLEDILAVLDAFGGNYACPSPCEP